MHKLILRLSKALPLLLSLCLLASCTLFPKLPPDYRTQNFEAEIAFALGELPITARVTAQIPTGSRSVRATTMQILTPPSLSGLLLSKENDTLRATCHGITTEAESMDPIWQMAELLTASGNMTSVSYSDQEGQILLYATLTTDTSLYEWYLDPDSGIPHRIQNGSREIKILSLTPQS